MAFLELQEKLKSVGDEIDSLINKVIDLRDEVRHLAVFNRKESLKILASLQQIEKKIQKCQDRTDIISARIYGMQQNHQYILNNEAHQLEQEKINILTNFQALVGIYNVTYEELVTKNFWAYLQDAWERFISSVTNLNAKILKWSFTALVRPVISGQKSPRLLPVKTSWWERMFGG